MAGLVAASRLRELGPDVVLREKGTRIGGSMLLSSGVVWRHASSDLVTRSIAPAASLRLRANPWSQGDGLCFALDRGATLSAGMVEFYGRNMPDARWDETQLVSQSQLYARHARIFDTDGVEFF